MSFEFKANIFAGLTPTTTLSGISFTTTDPAPITTLFPIETGPTITEFANIVTLSPILGTPICV